MAFSMVASSFTHVPIETPQAHDKQREDSTKLSGSSRAFSSDSCVIPNKKLSWRIDGRPFISEHALSRVVRRTRRNAVFNVISMEKTGSSWEAAPHQVSNINQGQFSERFKLSHITKTFPAQSLPSPFYSKSSCPLPNSGHEKLSRWEDLSKVFVEDDDQVLLGMESPDYKFSHQWVPMAGPRSKIYFEPKEVKAAIVTCGGLCPGLNDVIRQIVLTLDVYGVKSILGIRYGYRGFFEKDLEPIVLTRQVVQNIQLSGGSLLGVSRGGAQTGDIVDTLQMEGINMLFVLGGNGTHAGAHYIHEECRKRHMKVAVVGVPKTIDNDILLMDRTFGFDTAVEEAQKAINAAYVEATSAYKGIGLVKLMGRQSGFIAMEASLASGQVDVCLIPEVPFTLEGPSGLLSHLRHLVEEKGKAVVCIAEGAGQDLLPKTNATDASGNQVLGDIGVYLQQQIKNHFKEANLTADVKYIDPTYMIRACKANASDSILCAVLGQNAVHGAFAGYSGITVGICGNHYVYLPIPELISHARRVDPNSHMWHSCLTSTGQPDFLSHS